MNFSNLAIKAHQLLEFEDGKKLKGKRIFVLFTNNGSFSSK